MREITALAGRDLKIYLRDRSAVFFSLLSAIIVIVLMLVFLGDMNVKSITDTLDEFHLGSAEQNRVNAKLFILMWAVGGILCVNGVTVSAMVMSTMISDYTGGRLRAFRTAPLSRIKLSLGYIVAAWAASVLICLITLAASEIFAAANGAVLPDFAGHAELVAMILVNCFTYSGIMYFAGVLIKSDGAWSGFSTLTGTLVGFLGGIYIPLGGLPEGVQTFLKCLPVLHGCSMFRQVLTKKMAAVTLDGLPDDICALYLEQMGITVKIGGADISRLLQLAILAVCGIIFITAAAVITSRRYKSDR